MSKKTRFYMVDVRSILSDVDIESYPSTDELEESIIAVDGLLKPLILEPTGQVSEKTKIPTYRLLSGEREYVAVKRMYMRDKHAFGGMVNAIVISEDADRMIQKPDALASAAAKRQMTILEETNRQVMALKPRFPSVSEELTDNELLTLQLDILLLQRKRLNAKGDLK
jgi:hypothetical protein